VNHVLGKKCVSVLIFSLPWMPLKGHRVIILSLTTQINFW